MKKYGKIIILLIFMAVNVIMAPITKLEAYELSSSEITEKQLEGIISRYGEENLVFADGFSLNCGDEIDLSKVINNEEIIEFSSNDESIFKVEGNTLFARNEGVTFLIGKTNSKYYVFQVYVADNITTMIDPRENELRDKYLVYVDAGHGGKDPGTSSNGVIEKELNLKIALKVRDKLKRENVDVVMNRETDVFVDYRDTAAHANGVKPDVFVSIHNNASTSSSANGIETFYTKSIDVPYGKGIHSRLIEYTGANNRGLKQDIYYVTNHTKMPAVLVEGGFLTNVEEANKLKKDEYQEKIANAIVDGIMEYLRNNIELKPGTPEEPEKPDKPEVPEEPENPELPDGSLRGWIFKNNNWYYYDNNGEKVTGWLKDDGLWYYLDNSGVMAKGWLNIDGTWYYLHNSGAMARGWIEIEGIWYYLHDSGAMAKGWIQIGEIWYYLYNSGAMATGWVDVQGTWYYMYKSGAMATNAIIDGWTIDENGVATL